MEQTIEFRYDTQLLLDKYGIDDDEWPGRRRRYG